MTKVMVLVVMGWVLVGCNNDRVPRVAVPPPEDQGAYRPELQPKPLPPPDVYSTTPAQPPSRIPPPPPPPGYAPRP